jgi:hypothetical protein
VSLLSWETAPEYHVSLFERVLLGVQSCPEDRRIAWEKCIIQKALSKRQESGCDQDNMYSSFYDSVFVKFAKQRGNDRTCRIFYGLVLKRQMNGICSLFNYQLDAHFLYSVIYVLH